MSTEALKAAATGQIQKTENPVTGFGRFMEKFKPQMALALPRHLNADRMTRLAMTEFSKNPALQACDPKTILGSIMTACQLGLEIGISGQGFLVPYKTTCTFVPGWQGLVELVSRSGRGTVWTGCVFEGDEFDYAQGDNPFVKHKSGDEDDPKKITHVYAVGRAKGSDYPIIEVWTVAKIYRHLTKFNKVGGNHYALKDGGKNFEMYARKIPLLQVMKYMPKSIEVAAAIEQTHAAEAGQYSTIDQDFTLVPETDAHQAGAEQQPVREQQAETVKTQSESENTKNETKPAINEAARGPYESVAASIHKALNVDTLAEAADLIKTVPDDMLRNELGHMYRTRHAELEDQAANNAKKEPVADAVGAVVPPKTRARRAAPGSLE